MKVRLYTNEEIKKLNNSNFTNEEYARILDYKEKNKLSFSEAVCFLSISALNSNDILDRINFLESRLNYLIKMLFILIWILII